jgi:archaellum component FlaC
MCQTYRKTNLWRIETMLDNTLKQAVSDRLNNVSKSIIATRESIKNCSYGSSLQLREDLDDLENEYKQVKEQLDSLLTNDATLLDKVNISVQTLYDKITSAIEDYSIKVDIEKQDLNVAKDVLLNCKLNPNSYVFEVEFSDITSPAGKVLANRVIHITQANSGVQRSYSAGFDEKSLWQVEFENDLKARKFD